MKFNFYINQNSHNELKAAVIEAQKALGAKPDGYFGKISDQLVRNAQLKYGLPVTGIYDSLLHNAIAGEVSYVETGFTPSGGFKLSERSLTRLEGVHPDLVKLVKTLIAQSKNDFMVIEGVRTVEQQKVNVAKGASQTMKSRHIPSSNASGKGEAVDLGVMIGGKLTWDWSHYEQLAADMKRVAHQAGIPITWGGDWKTLKDGVHFELKR